MAGSGAWSSVFAIFLIGVVMVGGMALRRSPMVTERPSRYQYCNPGLGCSRDTPIRRLISATYVTYEGVGITVRRLNTCRHAAAKAISTQLPSNGPRVRADKTDCMTETSESEPLNSTVDVRQTPTPIRLIVRRGADRRFDALKAKTAHLKVVVSWDQRLGDRREGSEATVANRRKSERRRAASGTWDLADFVVVTPRQS